MPTQSNSQVSPDQTELDTALKKMQLTQRSETSIAGKLIYWIGISFALLHIYFNTLGTWSELYVSAIHFGGFSLICALMYPAAKGRFVDSKALLILDIALGIAAIACAWYLIAFEDALYERGVKFIASDWFFSFLAIGVVLELVRRTTGWFIPSMIVIALSYVFWWGPFIDGIFGFAGLSLETVMFRSFFSAEGMFGSIARISWTFVFMFILFGAFLVKSGAGEFIIQLSRCAAGRFVGGPGFVAVLGSGLMGSVSGSSVANTVSTGVITIPLMRKAGFPAKFAAAVEAAASTGGQLMPPVMGAGAFIMASYTQISYVQIIAIAALPALLYFLSVGFYVRVEAQRSHAQAVETEHQSIVEVFKQGWHFLLPLAVLVSLLVYGFTPTYAAGIAIVSVVGASWLSSTPMGVKEILEALAQGAKNMASTAILLVAIGLVVNVVAMTGIGNTFSLMVTDWANGSLLITLLLVAFASLILGMGLPVTAAYIVLATLSAPALYNLIAEMKLLDLMVAGGLPEAARTIFLLIDPEKIPLLSTPMSLDDAKMLFSLVPDNFKAQLLEQALDAQVLAMVLLSAHMIIFWLSQDSNVTPPVCLTAFAAAAIAKTPPMATGFSAWKVAKGLYIVPLIFAYTNFIGGTTLEVLEVFFFSVFGLYAFVGLMEGYLEGPLNLLMRLFSGVLMLGLLWPHPLWWLKLGCVVLFIGLFMWSKRSAKRTA